MDYSKNETALRQNLTDAGCSREQTDKFINMIHNCERKRCMYELSKYRCQLLDSLHKNQKCIDCLDYLVYMLEKENKCE